MKQVKYIGKLAELRGKTAIANEDPRKNDAYLVQFDGNQEWRVGKEHKLQHPITGTFLCQSWHEFPSSDFEVIE